MEVASFDELANYLSFLLSVIDDIKIESCKLQFAKNTELLKLNSLISIKVHQFDDDLNPPTELETFTINWWLKFADPSVATIYGIEH